MARCSTSLNSQSSLQAQNTLTSPTTIEKMEEEDEKEEVGEVKEETVVSTIYFYLMYWISNACFKRTFPYTLFVRSLQC